MVKRTLCAPHKAISHSHQSREALISSTDLQPPPPILPRSSARQNLNDRGARARVATSSPRCCTVLVGSTCTSWTENRVDFPSTTVSYWCYRTSVRGLWDSEITEVRSQLRRPREELIHSPHIAWFKSCGETGCGVVVVAGPSSCCNRETFTLPTLLCTPSAYAYYDRCYTTVHRALFTPLPHTSHTPQFLTHPPTSMPFACRVGNSKKVCWRGLKHRTSVG